MLVLMSESGKIIILLKYFSPLALCMFTLLNHLLRNCTSGLTVSDIVIFHFSIQFSL